MAHTYKDAVVFKKRIENENKALVKMLDRSSLSGNIIIIADRGYEAYNNMAHIQEKGWKDLIRIKDEYILQEIFARLTMYNFSELITSHVILEKRNRKHTYKVNFSVATHICREFLLGKCIPSNIEAIIARYITPIRPGRSRPRDIRIKQAISFMYRVA